MSKTIDLPLTTDGLTNYTLSEPRTLALPQHPFRSRIAFAAAHVVADPTADHSDKSRPAQIDWERTLAYRHHLWSLGFSVAEAMDTAQRGMGLDWKASRN